MYCFYVTTISWRIKTNKQNHVGCYDDNSYVYVWLMIAGGCGCV